MAEQDIDFEGTTIQGQTSQNDNNADVPANKEEEVTHLNGSDVDDITNGTTSTNSNNGNNTNNSTNDQNDGDGKNVNGDEGDSSIGGLNVGDQIDVDGVTYTVAENGNIVDEKGNVFKEAKDVEEWLKSVSVEDKDEDSTINLASLQEALGVTITDNNGNTVAFTDDAEGVKAYVNSVIELRSNELQQAAINRLYSDNPLLKQFQDYVQLTGTARGFGEIPDRSGIKIEEDNEPQQIAVIKMAANEFGNKTINDDYINWLRENGNLYSYAKDQLKALVDKDKAYRKEIETKAAEQRQQEAENVKQYWEKVNNLINGRVINGYRIPDSFTKEVDGKKIVVTANDFFEYLSNATAETADGRKITAYQRDLANLTDDEYLTREMLDAWLMFTGGTYKDLIDMAVKEEQVRKLVVRSKQNRSAKSVKVVRKQTGKASIDDIIL